MNKIKNTLIMLPLITFLLGAVFLSLDSNKYIVAPDSTEVEASLSGTLVLSPCGGEHGGACHDLRTTLSTKDKDYTAVLGHESISWLEQYLKVNDLKNTAQNLKVRFHPEKLAFKISEVNNKKIDEPAPWFYIH